MFGAGACLWELATNFGIARYLGWRGEAFTIDLKYLIGRERDFASPAVLHLPGILLIHIRQKGVSA